MLPQGRQGSNETASRVRSVLSGQRLVDDLPALREAAARHERARGAPWPAATDERRQVEDCQIELARLRRQAPSHYLIYQATKIRYGSVVCRHGKARPCLFNDLSPGSRPYRAVWALHRAAAPATIR